MRRAHSSNPNQKHTLELTLIDNKIDTNCLKNKSLIFIYFCFEIYPPIVSIVGLSLLLLLVIIVFIVVQTSALSRRASSCH